MMETMRRLRTAHFEAFGSLPLPVDHDEEEREYGVEVLPAKTNDHGDDIQDD